MSSILQFRVQEVLQKAQNGDGPGELLNVYRGYLLGIAVARLDPRVRVRDAVTSEDTLLAILIPASVTQVSAKFVPIKEEVAAAASGAIFPEILGEPQEEKPAESINPLCYVVLVGLIGLAKPDKFRLIRKNGTRDNSPSPGSITVVPLVNELEPWPKTTLVKRKQDETI